jgi:hypothetical protein
MSDSLVRDQQHRFMSKILFPFFPLLFSSLCTLPSARVSETHVFSFPFHLSHMYPRPKIRSVAFGSILFPCFTDSISVCYITCTSLYHVQQSEYRSCSLPPILFPSFDFVLPFDTFGSPLAPPSLGPSSRQPCQDRLRVWQRNCQEAPRPSIPALSPLSCSPRPET